MLRIALLSDTHGLLRPEALRFLHGCDGIVHAGDIGNADILAALAQIAPVTAVRGNNDTGAWAAQVPLTQAVRLAGVALFVVHEVKQLPLHPAAREAQVVVYGHSHRARVVDLLQPQTTTPGAGM